MQRRPTPKAEAWTGGNTVWIDRGPSAAEDRRRLATQIENRIRGMGEPGSDGLIARLTYALYATLHERHRKDEAWATPILGWLFMYGGAREVITPTMTELVRLDPVPP
ncbi:MAG: hypothetical protein ACYDCQ_20020 [Dehalococcoidia bacterium]